MFPSSILVQVLRKPTFIVRTKWKTSVRRNIMDVYTKEEYQQELLSKSEKSSGKTKTVKKMKVPEVTKPQNADIVSKPLLKLKYKKLRDMPGNAFYQMVYNTKTSKYRQSYHRCLLVGAEVISEAIKEGDFVKSIYFNRLHKLEVFPEDTLRKIHLTHIADRSLRAFPKHKCDGLFALAATQDAKTRNKIIDKRRANERKKKLRILPLSLVCNGVKDGTEMGEILKIAEEACCEQVFVIDGCADAWSLDALQAGQGAQFKIPIFQNFSWEKLEKLKGQKNIFISHHSSTGITFNDFVSDKFAKSHARTSSFVRMLEEESSVASKSKDDDLNVAISSVQFNEVNLIKPSLLFIGNVDFDAFEFLSAAKRSEQLCVVVNVPEDKSSTVEQAGCILKEADRQKQVKIKEAEK